MSSTETQTSATQDPQNDVDEQAQAQADVQNEDTSDEQSQSEAIEQNNEAPEATQEEEEPGVNAEDTAEGKLYAGKYKTVEDMEKAYQELQSRFSKETSNKAELNRTLNEVLSPGETGQQAQTGDDSVKRDMAVMKFAMSHPDANGPSMQEVLASDPMIAQINGYEAKLEYAYLRSQSSNSQQAVEAAQRETKAQTLAKVAEKESAQVESGQKSEPVDEDKETYNRATTGNPYADPDGVKQARQSVIRKHLVDLN